MLDVIVNLSFLLLHLVRAAQRAQTVMLDSQHALHYKVNTSKADSYL